MPRGQDTSRHDTRRVDRGTIFQTLQGEAVPQGGPTGLKSRDYGPTYSGSDSQVNLARRFAQLHGVVPFHYGEPQMLAMDHSEGIPLLEEYLNVKHQS